MAPTLNFVNFKSRHGFGVSKTYQASVIQVSVSDTCRLGHGTYFEVSVLHSSKELQNKIINESNARKFIDTELTKYKQES